MRAPHARQMAVVTDWPRGNGSLMGRSRLFVFNQLRQRGTTRESIEPPRIVHSLSNQLAGDATAGSVLPPSRSSLRRCAGVELQAAALRTPSLGRAQSAFSVPLAGGRPACFYVRLAPDNVDADVLLQPRRCSGSADLAEHIACEINHISGLGAFECSTGGIEGDR